MQLGRVLPKSPQGPSWLELVHGEKKDLHPAWAMLWYQVHVSTDRAFVRSFWATLPHENRGGWEGCEPLQLRLDPTPSVAFGVRSRDTSQISASVCSFVSSPLRHEQTPPGRRVSGPTEEVERMPCFTAAGDGSRTQILRRSALMEEGTMSQSRVGAGRETPQRNGPRVFRHAVSMPFRLRF